jgi:cobalt-zinc-cadmium efflux system outer membrane protein
MPACWAQVYPRPPEDPPDQQPLQEDSPFVSPLHLEADANHCITVDLASALQYARSSSPSLLAAHQRMRSFYWAYQSIGSLPSTQITAMTVPGTILPGSNPGGNNPNGAGAGFATYAANGLTDTFMQVTQPFWPYGSFTSAHELALRDYQVAWANYQNSAVTLRQNVKDAFYSLLAAQETLAMADLNLSLAEQSKQMAEKRFRAGAGPRLDFLDAQVQFSRAQIDRQTSQANLRATRARLAPLLGLETDAELIAQGQLVLLKPEIQYAQLLSASAESPLLVAAELSLKRSRTAVLNAAQQANPTPMFTYIRDFATNTDQYQIGVQIPLDWGQIRNQVRQNEEVVAELEQTLQATRLSVASNLKQAFESYQANLKNALEFQDKILKPSEKSTQMTQYGFQRGAVPYVRLLNSQINLISVRKESVRQALAALKSLDALEAASASILEPP